MFKKINKVIPLKQQQPEENSKNNPLKSLESLSKSEFSKKFNLKDSQSSEGNLYSLKRGKSQNKSFHAIMFQYDTKKREFDQNNFKEEVLGHEIRKEEVKEILGEINSKFIIQDLDCLHNLKKDLYLTLLINSFLTPIFMILTFAKRRQAIFLPIGKYLTPLIYSRYLFIFSIDLPEFFSLFED